MIPMILTLIFQESESSQNWAAGIALIVMLFFVGTIFSAMAKSGSKVGSRVDLDVPPKPREIPDAVRDLIPRDEAWRKPTGLRYLEILKSSLLKIEERTLQEAAFGLVLEEALEKTQEQNKSKKLEWEITETEKRVERLVTDMDDWKGRIERIFSGQVEIEIITLEAHIQKLQGLRQEVEAELQEVIRLKLGLSEREKRDELRSIDRELIDYASYVKELKTYTIPQVVSKGSELSELRHQRETVRVKLDIATLEREVDGLKISPSNSSGEKTQKARRRQINQEIQKLNKDDEVIDQNPIMGDMEKIRRKNINDKRRGELLDELEEC